MKHLKRIFESNESDGEDILENFISISDKFGAPQIQTSKFGSKLKWSLVWDIKMDFSVLQKADEMASKLKELTEITDDILSASDRLETYNVTIRLTNRLFIELTPKETGDDTYKFIKGYDYRTLKVRINEIERFFNSRGIRIIDWDLDRSYDEVNQTNELEIILDKTDNDYINKFKSMIASELNEIDERGYGVRNEGRRIIIWPYDEKSYIDCVR